MKVLFIADNRCRPNWGCRATSAALSQLLARSHVISARISGALTRDRVIFDLIFPELAAGWYPPQRSLRRRRWHVRPGEDAASALADPARLMERAIRRIRWLTSSRDPRLRQVASFNLELMDFEVAVINGEGTMIFSTPPRVDSIVYLLFVYWAVRLGRRVFMVNAVFSDCPRSPRHQGAVTAAAQLLGRCAAVCARDPRSRSYAEQVLGLRQCICIPDALFTWLDKVEMQWMPLNSRLLALYGSEDDAALQGCDLRGGYVCLSASSSAAWRPQQAVAAYAALIRQLRRCLGVPLLVVQTCGGESFLSESARAGGGVFVDARLPIMQGLNLLAHARLYISGRWHPGIMAAMGGTPCIFMRANSHKCRALQEQLGSAEPMEFPDIPDQAAVSAICERALQVLAEDTPQRREHRRQAAVRLACQAQGLTELLES